MSTLWWNKHPYDIKIQNQFWVGYMVKIMSKKTPYDYNYMYSVCHSEHMTAKFAT